MYLLNREIAEDAFFLSRDCALEFAFGFFWVLYILRRYWVRFKIRSWGKQVFPFSLNTPTIGSYNLLKQKRLEYNIFNSLGIFKWFPNFRRGSYYEQFKRRPENRKNNYFRKK